MDFRGNLRELRAVRQRQRHGRLEVDRIFDQRCCVTQMTNRYMVGPLGKGEIQQAFPLVRSVSPHLTMDRWVDYAQALYAPASRDVVGGVMSARNSQGYIFGIYCHVMEPDIEFGRIMRVSNFAAANLCESGGVLGPLIDSMPLIARDHGCGSVHVDLPDTMRSQPQPVQGVFNAFREAGYEPRAVTLVRNLGGT